MKKTTLLKTMLLLCALVVGSSNVWAETMVIDFESTASNYTDWTFSGFQSKATNSNVTAHGGSYFGRNYDGSSGVDPAYIVTKSKIASPTSITFYVSRQTTNSTSSSWAVQISTDGLEWTQVGDAQSATSMGRGTWTEVTRNLTSYSNVYVRVYYTGSTAVRCIDDLTLTYSNPSLSYWVATYDYNDGETANKEVNVDKTSEAATYTLEAAPTRENFTFLGWNDGTNNYNGGASYPMTKDKTFTAQWEYSGPCTKYNKSSKDDLATGAQYILVGDKSGTNHFALDDIATKHLYFGSSAVSNENSSITSTKATIVDEEPLVLTLEETADGWYLKNADGDKLGMSGDKEMNWNDGDMTWELGGADDTPTFNATYSSSNYTLYYNSSATRFNSYTSKGSNVYAYFYRLDNGKDVYTLTLNFNDGATDDGTHRVLEGASYTLTAPTRSGYTFGGWNTAADGSGTHYSAGAYTMPAANTTLYAIWSISVTVSDAGYATYVNSTYDLDFSESSIKAYKVQVTGKGQAKATQVNNVPANTPVLLYKEGGATEGIPVMTGAADVEDNDLVAGNGGTVATTDGDYTNMILNNGANGIGFYFAAGQTVAANRAYLHFLSSNAPETLARMALIFDDGETTAIKQVESLGLKVEGYYNLNGQRVNANHKGIVIVNGKKLFNK